MFKSFEEFRARPIHSVVVPAIAAAAAATAFVDTESQIEKQHTKHTQTNWIEKTRIAFLVATEQRRREW